MFRDGTTTCRSTWTLCAGERTWLGCLRRYETYSNPESSVRFEAPPQRYGCCGPLQPGLLDSERTLTASRLWDQYPLHGLWFMRDPCRPARSASVAWPIRQNFLETVRRTPTSWEDPAAECSRPVWPPREFPGLARVLVEHLRPVALYPGLLLGQLVAVLWEYPSCKIPEQT